MLQGIGQEECGRVPGSVDDRVKPERPDRGHGPCDWLREDVEPSCHAYLPVSSIGHQFGGPRDDLGEIWKMPMKSDQRAKTSRSAAGITTAKRPRRISQRFGKDEGSVMSRFDPDADGAYPCTVSGCPAPGPDKEWWPGEGLARGSVRRGGGRSIHGQGSRNVLYCAGAQVPDPLILLADPEHGMIVTRAPAGGIRLPRRRYRRYGRGVFEVRLTPALIEVPVAATCAC